MANLLGSERLARKINPEFLANRLKDRIIIVKHIELLIDSCATGTSEGLLNRPSGKPANQDAFLIDNFMDLRCKAVSSHFAYLNDFV